MSADADPSAPESALLRRIEWKVRRHLDGQLQGDYRTLMRGVGLDLADLREYQLHDDVRHIDWNVTARMDVPHVRVFTEDREMSVWFLLDLSASVDFGSGARTKRDQALELVGLLAARLTRHGNRVGAILYGNAVEAVIPPGTGRRHVLHLMRAVHTHGQADAPNASPTPKGKPAGKPVRGAPATAPSPTKLRDLLNAAAHSVRRRSTVFVLSDFFSEPGWDASLGLLAARHDVTAVRLLDPLERELPDLGYLPLRDAETGETLWVDTADAGFRARFAKEAAARETELRAALARSGVDAFELRTDDDVLGALSQFAAQRAQRLRMGGGATARRALTHPTSAAPTAHAASAVAA